MVGANGICREGALRFRFLCTYVHTSYKFIHIPSLISHTSHIFSLIGQAKMADSEPRSSKRSRFDQTEPEVKRSSRFDRRSRSPVSRHSDNKRSRSPIASGVPEADERKKSSLDPAAAAGQCLSYIVHVRRLIYMKLPPQPRSTLRYKPKRASSM